jgi:uncharacterized protein YggE
VQASKFSSTPKYGLFGDKAKSYRVENFVKITAQDEKEFQAVAGLVDAWPELQYDSVEFEHSDKDSLKATALSQALDKATAKKRIYEEKLGVKLTTKGFDEGRVTSVTPVAGRGRYAVSEGHSSAVGITKIPRADELSDEELPSSFSELVFKAQVSVEYAVETK